MSRRALVAGIAAGVAAALLGAPTVAMADTTAIVSTNTSYVDGTNKQTKGATHGSDTDIVLKGTVKYGYLEFVVSGLPAGATINSTTVDVFSRSPNTPHTVRLHTVASGWTESTLTWNNRPAFDPAILSSAPGDVNANIGEWVNLNAPNVTGNGTYRYALDVSSSTDQFYASDEYTTDPTRHPKLTVNWTSVVVVQPPVASFTANPTSGVVPFTVQFTDTSTNTPTSWSWAFGDGGTSTVQNPSHAYTAAGTYTASLTATNSAGSSTTSQTITATAPPTAPVASFTATPTSGTAPLSVSFVDTSTGAPTSWSWTFGDGGTSTVQSPSHTYAAEGAYTVTLTATNDGGSSSASSTITASAAPPTDPNPTAPVSGYGALTFRDEMDGPVTGVLNCYADHTYPCTNTGNSGVFLEAQCYKNENVTYTGGIASLTAKQETATCEGLTKSYTSGMLDFAGTASTAQYGVWEVKAKVPNVVGKDSVGLWSAIWNTPVGCWPPEADTMEIFGGSSTGAGGAMLVGADGKLHPKRFTTTYHLPDQTQTNNDYYGPGGDGSTDWSAAYHTWTYESRPGVQRFYVDSTLVKTVARDFPADVAAKCGAAASGKSKLLIDLALRDQYASWLPAELPASLDIDHVRYWN